MASPGIESMGFRHEELRPRPAVFLDIQQGAKRDRSPWLAGQLRLSSATLVCAARSFPRPERSYRTTVRHRRSASRRKAGRSTRRIATMPIPNTRQ